jgi:hypothetical protein
LPLSVIGQFLAAGPRACGLVLLVTGPQAHHEARRAEAALRAVAVHQALLHRMQRPARRGQVFHREQRLAVQRGQELDAGVDGRQAQAAGASSSPSTTVQAPQSPSAQPSLVPVQRASSRSHCSTVRVGRPAPPHHGALVEEADRPERGIWVHGGAERGKTRTWRLGEAKPHGSHAMIPAVKRARLT